MDKLDQRLNKLKKGYEDIPASTNSNDIMAKIRETEQKKQSKRWMVQLPYVASFIGVLLIGSILAIQLLSSPDSTPGSDVPETEKPNTDTEEGNDVTIEDIEAKIKELNDYYLEQKEQFENRTYVENAEELTYIGEVRYTIDSVKTSPADFDGIEDLDRTFDNLMVLVQDAFELPKTEFEQFNNHSTDMMNIIRKQEDLRMSFQNEITRFEGSGALLKISNDFFEQLELLNSLKINDPALLQLAKEILDNGYAFYDSGEGTVEVRVNYQNYLDNYDSYLDDSVRSFITLKREPIASDAALLITWDELADRIVEFEKIKNSYRGKSGIVVTDEYNLHVQYYLEGMDNTSAFPDDINLDPALKASYERFLTKYSDTETFDIIKKYYTMLENGGFKKTAVADWTY